MHTPSGKMTKKGMKSADAVLGTTSPYNNYNPYRLGKLLHLSHNILPLANYLDH